MSARATTIEDVAAAAGVSVATVSRALRGLPNVAPSTRARVQDVAAELRYRPDPSAAALAAGRTSTIAVAVPLLDTWYFSNAIAGAEAVLSEAGYDILVFTIDNDERRQRILGGPLVKRADGMIVVNLRVPSAEAAVLSDGAVSVVSVGMEVAGASSVVVDDFEVAREAVGHLVELGHRRVALVEGAPDDHQRFLVPRERRRGYVAALDAAGIDTPAAYEVAGNFSIEGGREAMATLLDLPDPPTAVFAMSDEMAFGALRELWDRGLDAPGDVSIIGVDDHDMSSVLGLTTIHQEVAEHGAVAAQMLLEHIRDPDLATRRHTASHSFVRRTTTGPPPS